MLFAEVLAALLVGPVVMTDSVGWGKLYVAIFTFPFLLAFWVVSGWTIYKHRSLRPLAAVVFILPFLVPSAWKLCEHLMGVETATRSLLTAATFSPVECVVLLPRQTALFIPDFMIGNKVFHILVVVLLSVMLLPFALFFTGMAGWLEDEQIGLLVIYAVFHVGISVALGVLTLCFAYLGLFQKPPRRFINLNITQIILAIILLVASLPLGWLIMAVLSGGLVG